MASAEPLRPSTASARPALSCSMSSQSQGDLRASAASPKSVRHDSNSVSSPAKRAIPRPVARSLSYSAPDTPRSPPSFSRAPLSGSPSHLHRSRPLPTKSASTPGRPDLTAAKTGSRRRNTPTHSNIQAERKASSFCDGQLQHQGLGEKSGRRGSLVYDYQTPPSSPGSPLRPRRAMQFDDADFHDFQLEASPASIKTLKPPFERAAASFGDENLSSSPRISAKQRSSTSPNLKKSFYAAPVRLSSPKSPQLLPETRPSSPLWPWTSKVKPTPNYTEELFGPIIPASSFSRPITPMPKLARSASMRSDSAVDTADTTAEGEMVTSSSPSTDSSTCSFVEWKAYLKNLHSRQPPNIRSDAVSV